jgi:hypothetical protein
MKSLLQKQLINDGLSVTVNTQLSKISGIEEMKSGYNKNYINDISDLFLTYPNTSAVTSMSICLTIALH